jgi:predicted N-acetyltransferase YhbS
MRAGGVMGGVSVELLADHLALSEVIGRWHWDEWGAEDPGGSAELWAQALVAQAGRGQVPTFWVAFLDGSPIGSVALVENDMDTREDLTPWLGGLYVTPAFRGRGVGGQLIQTCQSAAAALGYRTLYLHTVVPDFYARSGWAVVSKERYKGSGVVVMVRDLQEAG